MGTPNRVRRRSAARGAIVGLAVLLAACSGDDDTAEPEPTTSVADAGATGSSTTGPSTTGAEVAGPTTPADAERASFLVAGNEICREMLRRTEAIESRYGPTGPASAADISTAMTDTGVVLVETVAELRALTPPAGEEATVEALYVRVDELVALAEQASAAAAAADMQRFPVLAEQIEAHSVETNDAFREYGLDVCAE